MKVQEREEARRIRESEGASIKAIAKRLGVAKSSVSIWVRDVQLTEDQKIILFEKHPGQARGSQAMKANALEKRRHFQQLGRQKAKSNDPLHFMGCMLYWAEGAKDRRSLKFANSDPDMHRVFMRFLKESLKVSPENITFRIQCYTDHHAVEEIEQYWQEVLGLSRSSIRKTVVNYVSRPPGTRRRGLLEYGTCHVSVCDVQVIQGIFGAIQEYAGIAGEKWIE
jgi:transposase-like protein